MSGYFGTVLYVLLFLGGVELLYMACRSACAREMDQ